MRVRRLVMTALLAAVGLLVAVVPAQAAPDFFQPPTPYDQHYRFDPECPGQHLIVKGHAFGVDSLLNVAGSHGQAFLLEDHYNFRETWRNLRTGKRFIVSGHGHFTETSATFVANSDVPADLVPPEGLVGPVYLFRSRNVGNPFTVKTSDGRIVLRDHGVLVGDNLFDTLGDSQPGGTSLNFEVIKVIGPHPGLDADICAIAADLTGQSSS